MAVDKTQLKDAYEAKRTLVQEFKRNNTLKGLHYGDALESCWGWRQKAGTVYRFRQDPVPGCHNYGHVGGSKRIQSLVRRSRADQVEFKEINAELGTHLRRRGRRLFKDTWDGWKRGYYWGLKNWKHHRKTQYK